MNGILMVQKNPLQIIFRFHILQVITKLNYTLLITSQIEFMQEMQEIQTVAQN